MGTRRTAPNVLTPSGLPLGMRRMVDEAPAQRTGGSEKSATVRQPASPAGVQAARLLATRAFVHASPTIEVL